MICMERNIQRINGTKAQLHNYSDEELQAGIGFAVERRANAQHDIDALMSEQARRANVELPLGELVVHEFQSPSVTEITPPPAA